MTCICCGLLTYDHCRVCNVPLCWPCGMSGLCGICMRMEVFRKEHRMTRLTHKLIVAPLILSEGFDPWAASIAKRLANEETENELVEVKK